MAKYPDVTLDVRPERVGVDVTDCDTQYLLELARSLQEFRGADWGVVVHLVGHFVTEDGNKLSFGNEHCPATHVHDNVWHLMYRDGVNVMPANGRTFEFAHVAIIDPNVVKRHWERTLKRKKT
jgi:hypothetical protein